MKYIDETILNEEIADARDELQIRQSEKGQISDITPLQEHAAFLPVIVNYISDNFPHNDEIPEIIDEVAASYMQNAVSANATMKKEDIVQVLTILLKENWTKTRYGE